MTLHWTCSYWFFGSGNTPYVTISLCLIVHKTREKNFSSKFSQIEKFFSGFCKILHMANFGVSSMSTELGTEKLPAFSIELTMKHFMQLGRDIDAYIWVLFSWKIQDKTDWALIFFICDLQFFSFKFFLQIYIRGSVWLSQYCKEVVTDRSLFRHEFEPH